MEMKTGTDFFFFLFSILRGSLRIFIDGIRLLDKSLPRNFTSVVLSYMGSEAIQSLEH